MPLRFLKRGEPDVQDVKAPRTERSRREDRFEQDLREALRGQKVEVLGPVVLRDVLAFTITPDRPKGALEQLSQVKVDFALINPRTRVPFAGLILSSRAYGRDRRRPPTPTTEDAGAQRAIVTVLHLNPNLLPDAAAIHEALRPYLS
ncbi:MULTISPECIES: hypothetical protein [Deinococcus]|uniref:Uncharacterized protein n=2 Tax=Deinococcus TaxID=1298 RepID=A0A100HII3_9DEIO|nr:MULTISPECIES: hypothetical protein [Deinococcus]MXV18580.1 hypothetical protein [Deinococcus xianganensis]BBN95261.1 hypothetical protein DEGR_19940 [Deinococcus grandis]GAQ21247.1 hypothetical protein DEIGR_101274 [Deinococcus grandis]